MTFRMTGEKELDKALSQLEPKLLKKIGREAVRKAAKTVQQAAVAKVPIGKTKVLKESIKVRALKRSRKNRHRVGVRVGVDSAWFPPGTKGFYGSFVEYGTKDTPAQPFLRPAYDGNKEVVRRIFVTEITKLLEETVKEVTR